MPVIRGIMNPIIVQPTEYPPSDESLRAQTVDFMKENQPKIYRQFLVAGDLQEYLDLKVNACKRAAQNLIKNGVFLNQAWNTAIRQEILEIESD